MDRLKATVLMQVLMIIQIVLNIIVLLLLPPVGLIILIDTALVIVTYVGFTKGIRGWAIFATVYGAISTILSFSQGNFLNIGVGIMIAGIIALTSEQ